MSLLGKVALVTGAARGIGRASALALAHAGCNVAVNYLNSGYEATDVANQISNFKRRSIAVQADVTDQSAVARLIFDTEHHLGPIDILVNNAGVNPGANYDKLTTAMWHETIQANLTSSFLVSQAVIPGMRARHFGRLIFLSSIAGQTGGVIGPHYAASKAGQLGLMRSYATLFAAEGITSNAIAPALIDTDMVRNNPNVKPSMLPIGRFGTAEEVADAVVFLASNGYVTGQTLSLNGGWYKT